MKKSENLHGIVKVPGSKSYTHRVIAAAALDDFTLIKNPSNSDANNAMIAACRKLGADIQKKGGHLEVTGFKNHPRTPNNEIHVGNSGTALRLSIALASLAGGHIKIDGDASLRNRPTKPLLDALRSLCVDILGERRLDSNGKENEYAPIEINASAINAGKIFVDGTESSQYLSSLLLVAPFAKSDVKIEVTGEIVSKPYIRMTLEVMRRFGIKVDVTDHRHYHIKTGQKYVSPPVYEIPGDYSQAAFFLAAACLVKSDVTVQGLSKDDEQGDRQIVTILRKMGAKIEETKDGYRVKGPFSLKAIDVDLIDSPDLFPVLAVLGIYAEGKMKLHNMPQIRTKETDRIAVIEREFKKYGIKVESDKREMTVYHTDLPEQEYIFNADGGKGVTDHRIAMAFSLIGIHSGCAIIKEANSVRFSYPEYFDHLHQIGVETEVTNNKTTENTVAQRLAM